MSVFDARKNRAIVKKYVPIIIENMNILYQINHRLLVQLLHQRVNSK